MIDREKQRRNSGHGRLHRHPGHPPQDQAITESEGPIYDRSTEHLGSSDMMIIRVRRRLLMAAHALAEQGADPAGRGRSRGVRRPRRAACSCPRTRTGWRRTEDLRRGFVQAPGAGCERHGPAGLGFSARPLTPDLVTGRIPRGTQWSSTEPSGARMTERNPPGGTATALRPLPPPCLRARTRETAAAGSC